MKRNEYFLLNVDNLNMAESLRLIRNECKEYMTRYNKEISKEQQTKWFLSIDKNKTIPFLFFENKNPIGYGLITFEENISLISAGIIEKYRGLGHGKILFNLLINECKKLNSDDIKLEVLKTNIRAYKLYKKLGFKIVSEDQDKYTMKLE